MNTNHEVRYASRFTCSAILLAALSTSVWSVIAVAGDHKEHDAQAMSKEKSVRNDADGDGHLTRDAYQSMTVEPGGVMTEEPAGQGLPATEHQAETMRGFDDMDANGDGHIGADESGR